jgi:hypothetical protein
MTSKALNDREVLRAHACCACATQGKAQGTRLHAAVLDRSGVAPGPHVQPAGKGLGFYTGDDGYLYVDNLRIDDIRAQV